MYAKKKQITNFEILDDLLITFPAWFPFSYFFISTNFPSLTKVLFILTLFLFAETHFASTWLFFFDKDNWYWIKKNFYNVVFLPLYVVFFIFLIWIFNPSIILIFHYLASGWHVTKQSTGVLKVYGVFSKFYQYTVYFISFLCLAIGLANPGIITTNLNLTQTNLILLFSFLIYSLIIYLSWNKTLPKVFLELMPFSTGMIIYIPILFFKDLATATVIGVGMHWLQYLAIMWSSYFRKYQIFKKRKLSDFLNQGFSLRLMFIFIYAFAMTSFAFIGMPKSIEGNTQYSFFYLIPLVFQLYHFYIDGFIWKFSDPHIRKNILPFIFTKK
tara:strand:- start:349 stop:1332 length:984 start_codon:yes stop_codon:yes gene_type:complete